jgi:hypothetical protein
MHKRAKQGWLHFSQNSLAVLEPSQTLAFDGAGKDLECELSQLIEQSSV